MIRNHHTELEFRIHLPSQLGRQRTGDKLIVNCLVFRFFQVVGLIAQNSQGIKRLDINQINLIDQNPIFHLSPIALKTSPGKAGVKFDQAFIAPSAVFRHQL